MNKKRIVYFDVLNTLACIAVVALHCHGSFFDYENSIEWKVTEVVQILAHWAVPIFFMLTGATLMGYREKYDTKKLFSRRVQRIVVPFLIWSTFFLIRGWVTGIHQYLGGRDLIGKYLSGGILGIYWFFYPLFAVYLSLPMLSVLAEERNKKILEYTIGIGFLCYSVMPVVSILTQIPYNDSLQLPVAGGYVLYVLTGYYMSHTVFSKKIQYFLYAGGIIGAASMWLMTHWYTVRDGFASELFLDYKYCFSFAMAVGLFELCKNIPWEKFCHESGQKALSIIAQSSFGVYLIHIYFVEKYFEYTQGSHPILNMELGTILIYGGCVLIVTIVKKIPGGKILFP